MATQVYDCPVDGEFEIRQSILDEVKKEKPCPICSKVSPHKLVPCAGIRIMQGAG